GAAEEGAAYRTHVEHRDQDARTDEDDTRHHECDGHVVRPLVEEADGSEDPGEVEEGRQAQRDARPSPGGRCESETDREHRWPRDLPDSRIREEAQAVSARPARLVTIPAMRTWR